MKRTLIVATLAGVLLALTSCAAATPWAEKARAYVDTLDLPDAGKVSDYLTTACANPNLSAPEIAEQAGGAWDELTGGSFSDFADAVRVICPEQFE